MASVRYRPSKSPKEDRRDAWVVDYKDELGRRHLKTFRGKPDALKFRKRVQKDPSFATPAKPFTVADACERYLRIEKQRRRDGEITRAYLSKLWGLVDSLIIPELGRVTVDKDLSPKLVAEWVDRLRNNKTKPRSALVIRNAVDCLRRALTEAQRLELIKDNVIKRVPPRLPARVEHATRVPAKADVQALLAAADLRVQAIVSVAVFTGLRFGEIAGLTWDNVDLETREIRVRQIVDGYGDVQQRTKSKAGVRTVPISAELALKLREWRLAHARSASNLLFLSKGRSWRNGRLQHTPLNNSHFQAEWRKLQEKAGLTDTFRFHSLRHFAASLLIQQGLPPKHVQTLMGHASIQMTFDRYGHLFHDDDRARLAVDAINGQFQLKGAL